MAIGICIRRLFLSDDRHSSIFKDIEHPNLSD